MKSEIARALDALNPSLLDRSGSVFYTGSEAFAEPSPIYVLGLNPGGDPQVQAGETIGRHVAEFRTRAKPWSAYVDDSWQRAPPGTRGMQPRVRHMLAKLGVDPRRVPASNVVFVRSQNEAKLNAEKVELLATCWPVHAAVISALNVRAILCFGGTAGQWVRERIGSTNLIDSYRETNNRGWQSCAHQAPDRRIVVTLTHPSRTDWRNPLADPSKFVQRIINP